MEGSKEELVIQEYLNKIQPGLQGSFSVQCWARLWLPNGQCARSAFKEKLQTQPQVSRNVKFEVDGQDYFAEVQYFCHL
ncbi:hypothetical protein L208DRAFT_1419649 [Tricholoma matsutake]|nr:hypothetical protein L208DRAFT_1419649 [Tricholoma matsutake 945]